ncbi:MAG: hypothetical protein JST59_27105 [Actinobacteria bacterium]|nr:hypothetical protein [Actinomycetota bacterium]
MRIRRLTIASGDLDGQAAFYGERLGLPVRRDDDAVEVRLRESTIRFEPAAPGLDARYHFAIDVPRDSIHAAAAWLRPRAEPLLFDGDPIRLDVGAGSVYFLDAAGNVVELIAASHTEGDGGDFGPDRLIEVAEIGVAATDVEATSAAVQEAFGEPVVWSDSELRAVGDEHAVVIVAPVGRGWVPVDLAAVPLPTEVVAVGGKSWASHGGPGRL